MISISDTRYLAAVQILLYWIAISLFQTCFTLIEEDVPRNLQEHMLFSFLVIYIKGFVFGAFLQHPKQNRLLCTYVSAWFILCILED